MPVRKNINRPIDILDSRHMMSLILYINESGPSRRIDIYDNVSKNGNMPEKFATLIEHGIVEERDSSEGLLLALTDSGGMAARPLLCIEDLL